MQPPCMQAYEHTGIPLDGIKNKIKGGKGKPGHAKPLTQRKLPNPILVRPRPGGLPASVCGCTLLASLLLLLLLRYLLLLHWSWCCYISPPTMVPHSCCATCQGPQHQGSKVSTSWGVTLQQRNCPGRQLPLRLWPYSHRHSPIHPRRTLPPAVPPQEEEIQEKLDGEKGGQQGSYVLQSGTKNGAVMVHDQHSHGLSEFEGIWDWGGGGGCVRAMGGAERPFRCSKAAMLHAILASRLWRRGRVSLVVAQTPRPTYMLRPLRV